MKNRRRSLVQTCEIVLGFFGSTLAAVSFYTDAISLGELLCGLREANPIMLHQEGEHIAALAAAETMKDPFFFADSERRSFLRVERAKAEMILAGFLEGEVVGHDLQNRRPRANFLDLFLWNHKRCWKPVLQ